MSFANVTCRAGSAWLAARVVEAIVPNTTRAAVHFGLLDSFSNARPYLTIVTSLAVMTISPSTLVTSPVTVTVCVRCGTIFAL